MPYLSKAAGLVGNGWVGDVFSPGTVDCDTGRSSIGQSNFVLMIHNADLAATKRRSLMFRARIISRKFDCVGTQVPLTLSLGVVSRAPSAEGAEISVKEVVEAFLSRLSVALDEAKQQGGDQQYVDEEINF